MAKWFKTPFANTGDKVAIPDATDPGGNVSYEQGYGPDYERPEADPLAKDIERTKYNSTLNDITGAIQVIQQNGVFDWVSAATNGGVAVNYAVGSRVRYTDGFVYEAINATNALPTDTANWVPVGEGATVITGLTTGARTVTTAEARRPIIIISGSLIGAVTLNFPAFQDNWLIDNRCSGNFDVTVKTAAGTGLVIDRAGITPVYGDGTNIYGASGAGRVIKVSLYSGSGTVAAWNKDPRTRRVMFECIGAGGGGGGCAATAGGLIAAAGGGGGGGYAMLIVDNPVSPQTITTGAGGAGNVGNGPGGTGGTTSVGSLLSATGGQGGQGSAAGAQAGTTGGAGGSGSAGAVVINGSQGGASYGSTAANGLGLISGYGGAAARGAGSSGGVASGTAGQAGNNGGGGGAGGGGYNSGALGGGGQGGFGYCIVTEYA